MADIDLAAYLDLAPDERVIWQGRAAVGARWPSWPRLLVAALFVWGALVGLEAWHRGAPTEAELVRASRQLAVVPAGLLILIGGSKLVGPSYGALALAALASATFALAWQDDVARYGLGYAIERLRPGTFVAAVLFLGLPLAWIVERLTWRLGLVYVVTSRQVSAFYLSDGRPWRQWTEALWVRGSLRARLDRSWRCPEGWLVVGERELDLRGEDAARALDEVRAARARPEEG